MSRNRKRPLSWPKLTWLILFIEAVIFYIIASGFVAFPQKFKMPLLIALCALTLLMGLWTFFSKKTRKAAGVINVILSVALLAGSVFIPRLEKKMEDVFTEAPASEEMAINVYAFTTAYKEAHPEIMKASRVPVTSQNIHDYASCSYITQAAVDIDNQQFAVSQIQGELGIDNIWTVEKEDMGAALEAFYSGQGELIILNEAYIPTIESIEDYASFSSDTEVVYTISQEVVAANTLPEVDKDVTSDSFTVFVAGSDSRSARLTQYGRTDVDILMCVDPKNYQVMLVSFPRDAYIPNPSLGDGLDKLTHLGNAGIVNTMKGVSNFIDLPVEHYVIVNFATFKTIVDALGGIDLYNPYFFYTSSDASKIYYEYPEGDIHLDGDSALAYVRERQTLPNGDYGRNEHQTIALKAVLSKLTSSAMLSRVDDLLDALSGQFLTSIAAEDIYKIAGSTLDHDGGWNIITYHLGGIGQYGETASIPGRQLYVAELMQSQIDFVVDEFNKILAGEIISQQELPDEDNTVYIPN